MFRSVRIGICSVYSVCSTESKPTLNRPKPNRNQTKPKKNRTEQKTEVLKFYKNKSRFGFKP